ncbi:MAG: serine--tRNA ligase [bacterium]|nr:serine--tRNA ligase [bacterium]
MLDIKFIKENLDRVRFGIANKNQSVDLDTLLSLDEQRRKLLVEVETLKALRNKTSEEISMLKRMNQDTTEKINAMRSVSDTIKLLDEKVRLTEAKLEQLLLTVPNVPHPTVPIGKDERDNQEIRRWGEIPQFNFDPLPHWELGELHDILDLPRASKIAGARFPLYKGLGAKLERALINFMLDLHTSQHGYKEIFPPILANEQSMTGTGQLPKLENEMFKCETDGFYLIPTAEVPLTNIHRDEIIDGASLPLYYTAFTPCFRREAGAAGKDTRGLIRNHQFNKVELVKFVKPEESYNELEKLVADAEKVLQLLNLPYRVVLLCTADLSFAATKCYDIEVWIPSSGTYREISSCSNFEDFQARRANIKFRRNPKSKLEYVHTLNGSGLAIGRTFVAILENFQQADRSILIPPVLQPYMNGCTAITLEK